MSSLHPRSLVIALGAVCCLAFIACDGDDDKPASSNSGTTASGTSESTKPTSSSDGNKTGGASLTDACKLLTKTDASAALGGASDVSDGNPSNTSGNGVSVLQCVYTSSSAGSASVLARKSDPKSAAAAYDQTKAAAKGAVDVPGVGEKAFYSPEFGQMNVLVKDTWLIVSLGKFGNKPATPTAEIVALAKLLAGRI